MMNIFCMLLLSFHIAVSWWFLFSFIFLKFSLTTILKADNTQIQ
jgi:hypothetical protein